MKLFDLFKRNKEETEHTPTCDGCGLEYPANHLEYISLWDGNFCSTCSEMED